MKRNREHAAFFLHRGAGRISAAVLIAGVTAASAAPPQPARADAIPARSFVQDRGGDGSRVPVAATAGKTEGGGVLAASAHPAHAPRNPPDAGEPFDFVPTLRVTLHPLPEFDQPAPAATPPQEQLLFTPTGGGPAVALQLFLPAGSRDGSPAPFGARAGEDMVRLSHGAGGLREASLVELALADAERGYLAQLAPDGLDTLREARCAAAVPRPAGCEKESETDGAEGGLLSGATIPIPSAVVLLLAALLCLGAVAWRKRRLGL